MPEQPPDLTPMRKSSWDPPLSLCNLRRCVRAFSVRVIAGGGGAVLTPAASAEPNELADKQPLLQDIGLLLYEVDWQASEAASWRLVFDRLFVC